jgi:hypothetical protein
MAGTVDSLTLVLIASEAVTTGLFTLLGVLVGGAIAGAAQWFVAGMHEARVESRDRKQFASSVKTARRLLSDEIDTLGLNFRELARRGKTPRLLTPEMHYFPTIEWDRHRDLLARSADDDVWDDLVVLYHNAKTLRARVLNEGPDAALPKDTVLDKLPEQADGANELCEKLKKPFADEAAA